ncbi:hypothetical protein G647_05859 [Cladophialophora carrionii CBS 160.54]|uniref:Mid2 domain-containing protein n=1 Tax=Cladophialophora carrionii CBS 160.54 TaxID=1279043 RepID=V9D4J3_9EURO|nr:uncharacterized protein G647_05859 [Cladophialophora carrionii CBS 160.54]ETI21790.1 hypothetical protein G647_05859 [Cladophialophora carrionii CBS 160.54]
MSTDTSTALTDSVSVTTIGTTVTSLTTSFSTTITVTGSDTISTSETSSLPPGTITSVTSIPPSTTIVPPSTTPTSSPSVIEVTATITQTPSITPEAPTTPTPSVIVVTSTFAQDTTSDTATDQTTSTSSSATTTPSALSASGGANSSGGLGSGGKIAIAVVIPIVAIAAAFLIGFFLWRKRKARKNAEELRKSEMAEYGFNPNSDPTLAAVAGYADNGSEGPDDNSGYRGWGATSSNRKASTTLGSNGFGAGGPALSESSSQPGGYGAQASPNTASDRYSEAPLMNGHPESGDGVAALGAGVGGLHRHRSGAGDIRRGPSNASSAYSSGHQSDTSSDAPQMPGPYFQEEVPYNIYNDANASHGPYGDGSYGGAGGQPVIRDNQARRNTRIERAPTFPQAQGGIAQNF